jgi:predicted HAD superfamily Cof-like phosphohydrolase
LNKLEEQVTEKSLYPPCFVLNFVNFHFSKIKNMQFQDIISAVEKFHTAFKIENNYEPTVELSEADIELRHRLMAEENEEYMEAAKKGDLVEVADALGDMLYILCGTILKHGMQHKIEEVFQEIQRSNMSKLDVDGQPIYREDGKVMKSDQYFKPNIELILK